jgi:hypothetical protein
MKEADGISGSKRGKRRRARPTSRSRAGEGIGHEHVSAGTDKMNAIADACIDRLFGRVK